MKKVIINPPPQDGRCECCQRHVKDLKPFGKAGDPLVGDFKGAILLKTYRKMAMPVTNKRCIQIEEEYEKKGYDGFEEALIKEFGKKKSEQLCFEDQLATTVGASWECRNCIVLTDRKYFKRRNQNENKKKNI